MIVSGNKLLLLIHPGSLFKLDLFINFGNFKAFSTILT